MKISISDTGDPEQRSARAIGVIADFVSLRVKSLPACIGGILRFRWDDRADKERLARMDRLNSGEGLCPECCVGIGFKMSVLDKDGKAIYSHRKGKCGTCGRGDLVDDLEFDLKVPDGQAVLVAESTMG